MADEEKAGAAVAERATEEVAPPPAPKPTGAPPEAAKPTAREELEERLAKEKLDEIRKREKEEARKKTLWSKTKTVAKDAGTIAQHPNTLIFALIFFGGIAHVLKFSRGTWVERFGSLIDVALAVYLGIAIFTQSKQKNPIKRILYSALWPIGFFALSQGVLYILADWFGFLAAIPGLDFTLNQKYWPWWAIYAIWSTGTKPEAHWLPKFLMVGHGIIIFFLVFWPWISPVLQPILEQAQISREEVEKREVGMSRTSATAACVGEMISNPLNVDLQTCVERKMYPPTEEEVRAATIGRIKKALRQAVTASITIDPSQLFFLPEGRATMIPEVRGRVSATSINKDIEINLNCLINNKTAEITSPTEKIFKVRQSELGESEQFTCKPFESLTKGIHKITATGDIPDLEVNSVVVNFFIDDKALRAEQERFITSKVPEHLKIIEQWSDLKASTAPYSRDKAENFLNKEIYKSYIRATYSNLKVQSESDPGYLKLNLMTERIFPHAEESSAVVGLSNKQINFEIGITNNLRFGKILSVNSGTFEEFPSFLKVVEGQDKKTCPIIPGTHALDSNALKEINWKPIEYQKEKSFVCKLSYKPEELKNPEEIQTAAFSLTLNYDYQIEKKGTFEIKPS